MLSLIYKDLVLQKKVILFAAGYGGFLFIAFNNIIFKEFVYNMGTIAISYVILMTAANNDEKNKTDIILNSLPIHRVKLVLEKYLLAYVSVFLGLSIMTVLGGIMKVSGVVAVSRLANINDLLFSLSSVLLLSSLYFPLFLKFGSKYTRVINLFFFLGLFFLPSWLTGFIMNNVNQKSGIVQDLINYFTSIPLWSVGVGLLVITLVLNMISYLVSVQIYRHKEF
ncbi:MAG: ABC-2 transporter permease [Peptococcaceae bacterium]